MIPFSVLRLARTRIPCFAEPRSRNKNEKIKVFGIGLAKTGTSTLGKCFQELGYKHCSLQSHLTPEFLSANPESLYQLADAYDSFEDHPWMWCYRALSSRYPKAKFILTTRRDGATWLDSAINHAHRQSPDALDFGKRIFGHYLPGVAPGFIHETHRQRVLQFFAQHPGRLLEVCWEKEASWGQLCAFLGEQIPDVPFPHENRRPDGGPGS